jgi:hypothetical protein
MDSNTAKHIGLQFFAEPAPAPDPAPNPDPKPAPASAPAAKTFTQAEVDQMIQERLARVKSPNPAPAPAPNPNPAQPQQPDTSVFETQLAAMRTTLITAEVKSAMAIGGVKPEKVERAVRLVDMTKCVDDKGQPDAAKIKKEIEDTLKDFPELKVTADEGAGGFRIGADGTQTKTAGAEEISSIFGNKKKG